MKEASQNGSSPTITQNSLSQHTSYTTAYSSSNSTGESGDMNNSNTSTLSDVQAAKFNHGNFGAMDGSSLYNNGNEEDAGDYSCSVQLTVPNVAVAFLIGRGGATVGEMEHKSGARIRIAKPSGVDQGRIVLIKGSANSVRNAQSLVQARIDAYFVTHGHSINGLT